ncbi:3-phosphoshikimate 1-carboxyvinyltransferase [Kordiimonas sp. SCSIO 12610]|uniref:3-phosphoshikimate 1-carboxyvinyltransferase n=1 Tax=Kordiimonas sp. SCSIO 12610 TaxID=2829597 RepID=UPI00210D2BBB|nr:3-phosphoshikimate 1-carboxyvinyltransferase [Kordiimonas sp. SCSIO 12610]UTW55342.1 3-phosphoshikimate 1-carboxyvinyltransferase [Kordiimonas sp. SCSIO 12610]
MPQLISSCNAPLKGEIKVPGDKSISHRALMLSGLAVGRSEVFGLLEGEDVLATAEAMRAMGATINRLGDGHWEIFGVGVGGLKSPDNIIDMGNSGTSTRLLMGLMASHDIQVLMTGDDSLRSRPMGRVISPLSEFGAEIEARDGTYLPVSIKGTGMPLPIEYTSPVASAQVKSAVILAGLNTPGITTLHESVATRDHTERMLSAMGADIQVDDHADGRTVTIRGEAELKPITLEVPGDISSSAFPLVAASIAEGSDVLIKNVGLNPLRTGVIPVLCAMGADVTIENERMLGGEPVGDLHVKAADLQAIHDLPVDPSTMIDEFPVIFCAAATANGISRFTGLEELRVKESDRLGVMAAGLQANGVAVEELEDGLVIHGNDGKVPGGGVVQTHLDHRIAMSFSVLGLKAEKPITIDDATPIQTSFPSFIDLMNGLGAALEVLD